MTTLQYNEILEPPFHEIAKTLQGYINAALPEAENKIWHAHPVWFLNENPIVGYSKLKNCLRLLFWSGQSFSTPGLEPEGKFKAAEKRFTSVNDFDLDLLKAWLEESRTVQWDYKNLIKRKGKLERIYN